MPFCYQPVTGLADAQNHAPRCLPAQSDPVSLEQHSRPASVVTTSANRRKRRLSSPSSRNSSVAMDSNNLNESEEAVYQYLQDQRRPRPQFGVADSPSQVEPRRSYPLQQLPENMATDDISLYGLSPAGLPGMSMAGLSWDAMDYITDPSQHVPPQSSRDVATSSQPDYSHGISRVPLVPDHSGNTDYNTPRNEPHYPRIHDFHTPPSRFWQTSGEQSPGFQEFVNSANQGFSATFQNAWHSYIQTENNRRSLQTQPITNPFPQTLSPTSQASQNIAQAPSGPGGRLPVQAEDPRGNGVTDTLLGPQSRPGSNATNPPQRRAQTAIPRRNRAAQTGSGNSNSNSSTGPASQPSNTQGNSRRRGRRTTEVGGPQQVRVPQPISSEGLRQLVEYSRTSHMRNHTPDMAMLIANHPDRFRELYRQMELDAIQEQQGLNIADARSNIQQRRRRNGALRASEPKGLDNANDGRPPPKENEELTVNLECKACMSQLVDTVMLPCGHAVLCQWCANQHMPSSNLDPTRPRSEATCPMCRVPVKQKLRIYIN